MPTSNQTQIFFDFGVSTYSVNGFGAGGTIAAGNSATFHAIGLNFTYSSAGSNSNFDSSDSGMLNVRGTDTMMLTLGNDSHTFSNLTLDFGIVYGDASITFLNSTGATVAQYTAADILADIEKVSNMGINSIPTFIINNKIISGAAQAEEFERYF